jgi:hypothetical protein
MKGALSVSERQELIHAIASREGTAEELAEQYGRSVGFLRRFTENNLRAIELASEGLAEATTPIDLVTPATLAELWISNKTDRLTRYQNIADRLYTIAMERGPDSTVLRELRFYMLAAANELGQLLHRGSGDSADGDKLQVEFLGVDPDSFK